MTRNELQNELRKLGFKALCNDGKTLIAYNQIQGFLKANKTPIRDITGAFLWGTFKDLHVNLVYGFDVEVGYSLYDE